MPALTKEQVDFTLDKLNFTPTDAQKPILYCPNREILVAGGDRSGKSRIVSMFLTTRLLLGTLYWLVAEDYARTRAEFDYICEDLTKLNIDFDATKQVDPGEIYIIGGIRIATKSAKDPRKLAVEAPDGVVGCEASQFDYETYLRLRGRIAEKRGWMILGGSFESSLGWYPELYTRGQFCPDEENLISFTLPTWSNTFIFPEGRQDPEILKLEAVSSKDWFLERYGGQPCPPKGRVFEEFSLKLHTGISGEYEFDPSGMVLLWIDPGYATAYSVLAVQIRGEHVYVIDEIFESGFVTSDIIKIAKNRPWWDKVTGGAIDIAAKQHQAMPAPAEVWLNESGVFLRSQRIEIRDGIERTKTFLTVNPVTGAPRLHINARCKGVISELGGCPSPLDGQSHVYKWKLDREGHVAGETPEDKDNHACKALAYGLVDSFGYTAAQKRAKIRFF